MESPKLPPGWVFRLFFYFGIVGMILTAVLSIGGIIWFIANHVRII